MSHIEELLKELYETHHLLRSHERETQEICSVLVETEQRIISELKKLGVEKVAAYNGTYLVLQTVSVR
jgi:hypothetical protein